MKTDKKYDLSFSVHDVLPYCDEFFATMEGTVTLNIGLGDEYYMFSFWHDGQSLSTDGEGGSSAQKLVNDLRAFGLDEGESIERAWEIMREVAEKMYRIALNSSLHEPGMDRFALV